MSIDSVFTSKIKVMCLYVADGKTIDIRRKQCKACAARNLSFYKTVDVEHFCVLDIRLSTESQYSVYFY